MNVTQLYTNLHTYSGLKSYIIHKPVYMNFAWVTAVHEDDGANGKSTLLVMSIYNKLLDYEKKNFFRYFISEEDILSSSTSDSLYMEGKSYLSPVRLFSRDK